MPVPTNKDTQDPVLPPDGDNPPPDAPDDPLLFEHQSADLPPDVDADEPDADAKPAVDSGLILGKFKSYDELMAAYAQLEADKAKPPAPAAPAAAPASNPAAELQARLQTRAERLAHRLALSPEDAWEMAVEEEQQRQADRSEILRQFQAVAGPQAYAGSVAAAMGQTPPAGVTASEVAGYIAQSVPMDRWGQLSQSEQQQLVGVAVRAVIGDKVMAGTYQPAEKRLPAQDPPNVGPGQNADAALSGRMGRKVDWLTRVMGLPKDRAIEAARRSEGRRR